MRPRRRENGKKKVTSVHAHEGVRVEKHAHAFAVVMGPDGTRGCGWKPFNLSADAATQQPPPYGKNGSNELNHLSKLSCYRSHLRLRTFWSFCSLLFVKQSLETEKIEKQNLIYPDEKIWYILPIWGDDRWTDLSEPATDFLFKRLVTPMFFIKFTHQLQDLTGLKPTERLFQKWKKTFVAFYMKKGFGKGWKRNF